MAAKTKLELTWIDKENRPRLEPRILLEDAGLSHHSDVRREGDLFDNVLIRGDNLLALKALEAGYEGKVKCVLIDPPYNTGSAFTQYDDGVEHSIWLGLIRERLSVLKSLMTNDGSIWVCIDDNECHYLKILMDEVFGRNNFLGNIVWQSKDTPGNNSREIAQTHNHILGYKSSDAFAPKLRGRSPEQIANYKNPDNDERGPWLGTPLTRAEHRDRDYYSIPNGVGRGVWPPKGSSWRRPPEKMKELQKDNRIYWGKTGNAEFPVEKKFLSEVKDGVVNQTWWPYEFAGSTRNASAEMKALFGGEKSFDTPKPEKLISRILEMVTEPEDIVLDSFAGSGTTGAVAHKMGRRWIMVELGDHCETLIVPRLKQVVGGEQGGVSKAVGWKGGGGYRYFKLAPSLLEKDRFGQWVISKAYNAEMLAEAMCKHFGFAYAPSTEHYWMHGSSSETDFVYVTTNSLTHDQLRAISDEVGTKRTLLICCKAFQGANADEFDNLTIRKIPGAILDRCEWGKDDYSLKIEALPMFEDEPEIEADAEPRRKSAAPSNQPGLFNGDEEVEA